ncbi:MAG: hypothetical protein ACRC67_22675 [Inquilinus sp.]|uniref:hypothetical protein n=1 Tax=Inquilinus sp. TaxID=1932117 RepID=UPI003F2A6181
MPKSPMSQVPRSLRSWEPLGRGTLYPRSVTGLGVPPTAGRISSVHWEVPWM